MGRHSVYMAIDLDEYELPYAVADSVIELAQILGVNKNAIYSLMSHVKSGMYKRCRYIKVEIEED